MVNTNINVEYCCFRKVQNLVEDAVPNLEGVYFDPLYVIAKQLSDMTDVINQSLRKLRRDVNVAEDATIRVVLKMSQDGLSSAPEIRSKQMPVLPDKVFRSSLTFLQFFVVDEEEKKHILYRTSLPNSPFHPCIMVNRFFFNLDLISFLS